jgi:predicted MPP superfamily phosphohydrolase
MIVFFLMVLGLWALWHVYVAWRVAGLLPSEGWRRLAWAIAALLWASYPLARMLERTTASPVAGPLEWFAAIAMGAVFIAGMCLIAADGVTVFGLFWPGLTRVVRAGALVTAGVMTLAALGQGIRRPVVRRYEVRLRGLPPALDGTRVLQLSDLHLGTILGSKWLARVRRRVERLHPDLIVFTGDVLDGSVRRTAGLEKDLSLFSAPKGVWAVTGNHEYYAGLNESVRFLEQAGMRVLRDRAAEAAPGLVLAGVDDLSARRQYGERDGFVRRALAGRPPGGTILLCHSPLSVEDAANSGAGLMLSGHTHGGQIWPFGEIVQKFYPRLAGRFEVEGMTLIVSRGTGSWGPPMRLWAPGEMNLITLRTE